MNGWFFLGGLAGIVATLLFEWFVAVVWDLPRDGVEVDDEPAPVPASEVVARFTNHVRVVPPADVIDIREVDRIRVERWSAQDPDAGHVTVGQALGVVLVLAALVLLAGLVGAVETAGLS